MEFRKRRHLPTLCADAAMPFGFNLAGPGRTPAMRTDDAAMVSPASKINDNGSQITALSNIRGKMGQYILAFVRQN